MVDEQIKRTIKNVSQHNITVVIVSFERLSAKSIFPLCIESDALEKYTNKSVTLRFFDLLRFDGLLESVIWNRFSENHFDSS